MQVFFLIRQQFQAPETLIDEEVDHEKPARNLCSDSAFELMAQSTRRACFQLVIVILD